MTTLIKKFSDWPRNKDESPRFGNTQEALLFAQLIWDKQGEFVMMHVHVKNQHLKLKNYRENKQLDLNYLITLATQAQLLRECMVECERIEKETDDLKRIQTLFAKP
ncbi:MAG TPA: hypothetical protein VMW44_00880 [Candidatus Bathyarchaeia archaeon]|nr:hypothetical protein [Candidatus Bathyarchaeia archaeon]